MQRVFGCVPLPSYLMLFKGVARADALRNASFIFHMLFANSIYQVGGDCSIGGASFINVLIDRELYVRRTNLFGADDMVGDVTV